MTIQYGIFALLAIIGNSYNDSFIGPLLTLPYAGMACFSVMHTAIQGDDILSQRSTAIGGISGWELTLLLAISFCVVISFMRVDSYLGSMVAFLLFITQCWYVYYAKFNKT